MLKFFFISVLFVALFTSCGGDDCDLKPEECDCETPISEDILPTLEVPTRTNPQVLVLLYHNLVYGRTGSEYNRDIYNFENDLKYLRRNFKIIDFNDLDKINKGQMQLTTDAAIITFDDGDLSMYHIAFPMLKKYNFKATFFIVSTYVNDVGYVSWEQLNKMAAYKNPDDVKLFSFGSHTATHAPLGELTLSQAEEEMRVSKATIEQKMGITVEYLALPYGNGANSTELQQTAQQLGYKGLRNSNPVAITTFPSNMFTLPAYNVENYSNDVFIQNMTALLGR